MRARSTHCDASVAAGAARVKHKAVETLARALVTAQQALVPIDKLQTAVRDVRGMVAEQDGAYFGSALNLTARVAAYARGGQILCTGAVRDAAATIAGVQYVAIGPVQFKNILNPVPLFEIVQESVANEAIGIDPVCRMQVSREGAPARLPFGGTTYYFCSFECARAFADQPERYAKSTA